MKHSFPFCVYRENEDTGSTLSGDGRTPDKYFLEYKSSKTVSVEWIAA
jgi:hypothetical protein